MCWCETWLAYESGWKNSLADIISTVDDFFDQCVPSAATLMEHKRDCVEKCCLVEEDNNVDVWKYNLFLSLESKIAQMHAYTGKIWIFSEPLLFRFHQTGTSNHLSFSSILYFRKFHTTQVFYYLSTLRSLVQGQNNV